MITAHQGPSSVKFYEIQYVAVNNYYMYIDPFLVLSIVFLSHVFSKICL
jgi:hypothetical protein